MNFVDYSVLHLFEGELNEKIAIDKSIPEVEKENGLVEYTLAEPNDEYKLKCHLKEGIIDVFDKVRTMKKAIEKGIDEAVNVEDPSQYYWMIISDDCDDMVDEVKQKLEERTHQKVERHLFGAVILSHTGPGVLAFGKMKKLKKILDN